MKRHVPLLLFFLAGLLVTVGPLRTSDAANSGEIRVSGSSTIKPVVMVAARILGRKHNMFFSVTGGNSSHGVQETAEGHAEIGMADRYLEPMEVISYPDLRYYTIGFDGIALIVNQKNPIKSLTKSQVQRLFTGGIRNWREIGGEDAEVVVVSMEMGESSQVIFSKYFGLHVLPLANGFRFLSADGKSAGQTAQLARRNSEAIVKVGEYAGAIGYLSMGAALRAENKLGTVRRVDLEGIAATRDNVKNKTYPIVRPLNVVSLGEPKGNVKVFVDYLLSAYGQNIVKNLDYTPIR